MKKNYVSPSIELIEIEVEDAVLQMSTGDGTLEGLTFGSEFGSF